MSERFLYPKRAVFAGQITENYEPFSCLIQTLDFFGTTC